MKGAIILIAMISLISCQQQGIIIEIVKGLVSQIPSMKEELNNQKSQIEASKIRPIIGQGYTFFQANGSVTYYKGITGQKLAGFLNFIQNSIKLPLKYQSDFIETMSMIEYTDYEEIISSDFIFSLDEGGNCKYVCIMGQRNENESFDWLVGDIKAGFNLAPNFLMIKKTKRNMLSSTSSTMIIEEKKSLTESEIQNLNTFMQISIYQRFNEILKLSANLK